MVALLLLHLTGFDADHPNLKLVNQIKVPHWLKETLQLTRSQARLLIGTIGTGLADGLFYSWIVTLADSDTVVLSRLMCPDFTHRSEVRTGTYQHPSHGGSNQ